MKKWFVVIVLAMAQFIMVLDSSVMNVSISQIVADLNTSVSGLQLAITLYTLVMASFMLTGGKLGDKWGRLKAFKYGLLVYGLGSLITSLSPTLPVLLIGWSMIEGLGAVLVIPAIIALIATNYQGKDRVIAYSIIGAASGAAIAAGPLIGGAVTTYFSWRYVFAGEVVVVVTIFLFFANKIKDVLPESVVKLDFLSIAQSVAGLFIMGIAILQAKVWGWITPLSAPVINGHEITPFGLSVVPFLLVIGAAILWWFNRRQQFLIDVGRQPLLDVRLMKIPQLRAGLSTITIQYLLIAGLFFVMPIFLQLVLGLDALKTGVKITPLSISLILFSFVGARMAAKRSAKQIIVLGLWATVAAMLVLLSSINTELTGWAFTLGMFLAGAGLGLITSQVANVIISSAEESKSSELGGVQGTFQNLGSSLGTALIGTVLIASLTTGFLQSSTGQESTLPVEVKDAISRNAQAAIPVVSRDEVYQVGVDKGLTQQAANDAADYYLTSQLRSLKISLLFLTLFALLGLFFSRKLPSRLEQRHEQQNV